MLEFAQQALRTLRSAQKKVVMFYDSCLWNVGFLPVDLLPWKPGVQSSVFIQTLLCIIITVKERLCCTFTPHSTREEMN